MRESRRKEKLQAKQRTIDQLEFQVNPVSFTSIKQEENEFYLYIEKGAQVLGKVDERINGRRNTHMFSKQHNKAFRVSNDKNLTYQWSIYKCTPDNEEEYLESISFNIKSKYVEYLADLEAREADLYRIYAEKEKKTEIEEIWRDLRCDLTHNMVEMSCKFVKLNATVTFNLIIKCDLDFRYEKWEEERELKRLARTTNGTRKGSMDSRNKISEISFYESKEKINEVINFNDSLTLPINLDSEQKSCYLPPPERLQDNGEEPKEMKNLENVEENLRESEIRVTNPEGIDVTDEVPEKFLNHKRTDMNDYYYRKKSSMLSDIIEESYEGSSNVITKSNQGEKLKSVDEIHEEEEQTSLFSPLIKTQNYDAEKDEEYFDKIKRTTTLVQKASQEFETEESPKATPKRYSHYYPNVEPRNQLKPVTISKEKEELEMSISDTKVSSCSRKTSFTEEEDNEAIQDFDKERRKTIKNIIKMFVVLVLFVLIINRLNLFDHSSKISKNKISPEKRKEHKTNSKSEDLNKKERSKKSKFSEYEH